MKRTLNLLVMLLVWSVAWSQSAQVKWQLSNVSNLSASTISGDAASLLTTSYLAGADIAKVSSLPNSNAADGYTAVTYTPAFASYYVSTRKTARTSTHCVSFGVTPASGHTFKPLQLSFDAVKVGTDGGNFDVCVKPSGGTEVVLASNVSPLRNTVNAGNANAYSHHEYTISDQLVQGKAFIVTLYIYNINGVDVENPKSIGFRNVELTGRVDEPIYTAEHYVSSLTCKNSAGETLDLTSLLKGVKNGATVSYPDKLYGAPTDFKVTGANGASVKVAYANKEAVLTVTEGGKETFRTVIRFVVTNRAPKPAAKPLKRGLMSLSLSGAGMGTGNLVSWRFREADDAGVKFKLYRGTSAALQTTKLNAGNFITSKTNFRDASGSASSYYKLEVYDKNDNLIETEVSGKTWSNQSLEVPLGTGPTDPDHGATYTPNDASFCDMDGDGEYEIILKWSPSNEKDAASSGTTSSPYFDCLKLDGTRLWRIRLGDNFFTSAHTIQFIAWDFDGDGYGEFMCKTAPGTVDGEGNYVLLGNDDPKENLLSGRGKQDHGSEYITVFDGLTGAEISTIPYHTDYTTGRSYWGDSDQNRSERYLAALAYLDGPDKNPSPIFARGYYSGAFVAAYDFDGDTLRERWVSRSTTSGQELWGEGAHWISVGDVDEDGKQEIIYGSAALDHDGSLLYRTGLGHGDALHLGDMIPEHPGLEVLMCHEHKPYGIDIRDARTGTILQRQTEGGDTGRGLAAHFDSSRTDWQFLTSARAQMYNCSDQSVNTDKWAIGSSGAGINCRVYWDGDLYDEFFDKSIIAHYNPSSKAFDRYKFNNGNYLWGTLNNGSKNNPCVLGDLLGDWREEIVTWTGDATNGFKLYVNATSFESEYRVPHLMDDLQYRVQVANQNVAYNQPPHLSYDPAVRFGAPLSGQVEEGTYYVQNVATGKFLQGGSYWGTRAIVGEHASVPFTLKLVGQDAYTFDSHISNGNGSQYLSAAELPYVDGASAALKVKKVADGVFTICNADGKYLHAVADSVQVSFRTTSAVTSNAYRWRLVPEKELLTSMPNASMETPVDVTFLVQDANFGRNDQRYSAWQWSSDCTNNKNEGAVENYCVESWHSTFTFSQQLTGIPNGIYGLKAQGFYRVDGSDRTAPVLFAGNQTQPFGLLSGGESSMAAASASFSDGKYALPEVLVEVTDGTLTIGVRNTSNTSIWVIWDNMELTYYGDVMTGDVDRNLHLTTNDVQGALKFVLKQSTTGLNEKAADVNKDGKITVGDAVRLIDKLLKAK